MQACIVCSAGLASYRCLQVNSNVRLRKNQMLCRCFHPLSVNTRTRARTEFKPVFLVDTLSEKCVSAPSGPAALTSFGVRGAICGGQLSKMKTMVWATRLHIEHALGLREASACHRSKPVGAMPAHPTFGTLPNP